MKAAISLPDELFKELDAKARALKMSRSGVLAQALREFLEREGPTAHDATDAWNRRRAARTQVSRKALTRNGDMRR